MKGLPREYLELAGQIMREFPIRRRERKLIAETIEAMCHTSVLSAKSGGAGSSASEPERVAEALDNNKNYQCLVKFCQIVDDALETLSFDESVIVQMAYWEGATNQEIAELMSLDERTVRRYKGRGLRKLASFFLHPDISMALGIKLSSPGQG